MGLNMKAVILAGGIGSRLWPLSRELYPKQLLRLTGRWSLFQVTLQRAIDVGIQHVYVVAAHAHRFFIREQIDELALGADITVTVLLEPEGKNTAAAIALVALTCDPEDVLWVMPADHVLDNPSLQQELMTAAQLSEQGALVTFGVKPTAAQTGYGYIHRGEPCSGLEAFNVKAFKEKPPLALATTYYNSGEYYWNSGMFCFLAQVVLDELAVFADDILQACRRTHQAHYLDLGFIKFPQDLFALCPENSIDYAVMEKTSRSCVVPLSGCWSDVGAWSALYDLEDKDANGNVLTGDVIINEVKDALIKSHSRLVAVAGVDNIIVVETGDAVLVADRSNDQMVKSLVQQLRDLKRDERVEPNRVLRPWGLYRVLSRSSQYEVRQVQVHPGATILAHENSGVQKQWSLVSGAGLAEVGGESFRLSVSTPLVIPAGERNEVTNTGTQELVFIEIQLAVKPVLN